MGVYSNPIAVHSNRDACVMVPENPSLLAAFSSNGDAFVLEGSCSNRIYNKRDG